jgi:hypothetical protein
MLSYSSQTQKNTQVIPFLGNVQNEQVHRDRGRLVVARGMGDREWKTLQMDTGFLLGAVVGFLLGAVVAKMS